MHIQHKRVPFYSRDSDVASCILITRHVIRDNILSQTAAMLLRRKQLEGYSEAWELHHRATVLIPMSDDPSRTWSSVRRVSESVCRMRGNSTSRISKGGIYKGEVLQRCHREPLNNF